MQRKVRSPRFPMTTTGRFGQLVPIHKSIVVPGETMKSINMKLRMQSLPIKRSLAGAYVDVWYFYVPMRVAWGGWVDFISKNTGTIPVHTNAQPRFFVADASKSNLYGKAYEEIVNHYFRTDEDTAYSYDETCATLPIADLTGELNAATSADELDQTIDVTSNSLSINEVEEKRAILAYDRRLSQMDGTYSGYLKTFGVNASEGVTGKPEWLGHYRKWINPSKAIDQATGNTVQSYFHDVEMKLTKPRFFAEHGFIVGVASIRPKLVLSKRHDIEFYMRNPEEWPSPRQMEMNKLTDAQGLSDTDSTSKLWSRDNYFAQGEQLYRKQEDATKEPMVQVYDPATLPDARFPTPATYDDFLSSASTLEDLDHFALDGVVSTRVVSPLRLKPVK